MQIALYELNCDVPFDPTQQSDGIQPSADQLVSDCSLVSSPQQGTVNFTVNTQPGQVYGIVVDGWSADECKVEVQEVLSGGEPPELEEDLIGEPEFDPIPPWDKDTICAGAVDVPFTLVGEVPNACTYIWTLENVDLMTIDTLEVEDPTEVLIDFPEPGEYEICVSATNLCASTEPVCRTVWVLPLTPEVTIDTLCKREPYVWLGPFGEVLETYDGFADDWGFGMNPNPGPFEDMRVAENQWGCVVDAFLELYVVPDNYLPTVGDDEYFQEVICFGDNFEMPDGSQYTQTGIFGTEGEIFIPQQSFPECDSFFILELSVLEVRLNWADPACIDNVIFIYVDDVPTPPEFLPGGAGQEIYIQWVRLSDNDTLFVGTQSAGTLLDGLVWEITPDDFNSDIETFEATIIMDIDGEPDPGCLFGPWEITIDLNDLYPDEPDVTYPDVVCTDNLVAIEVEDVFGSGLEYEWEIMLDSSDYIIVNDSTETLLEIIFLTEETVEICITPYNLCGPGDPACIEIEVSEPPVSDAGPDDISCDLTYTMQGGGDNGEWTVASRPMNSTVNFVDNTDPQTDVTVNLYGEYSFVWTERIGNLVSCATNDTVSIFFNEPPLITNIRYECDSLGQFYTATFDIIGVTGPYELVVGPGTIDSASYTSPLTPDLQPIEVVVSDGNGCESELIVLNVRCDCPTEVGQLNILALNLCEDDCFETENYYDDSEQVYVPGQDTVLFFLQTTNMFSVDEDDWVDVNNDGVFCGDVLNVDIDVPYYVYVAVGPIDSLTGFIDLDLEDFENCTRITQRKPITWRGQPIAEAFGGEICGVEFTLNGTASFGDGLWTQISGPGTIDFDDANDVNTSITADLCGDYQLQWRESNFGCADSIQVDVGLNCIPELGDVSFNCDNEDISYWLSFEIESGTQDFEVVYPTGYENAISGSTFTHPAVPNRGEVLDTFLIVDANGCELEVILDINCNCQPIPGEMDGEIDVCESQNQVEVGDFIVDPFFEPGDVGTFVLHTSPGTDLVDPLVVNDAGVFNFDDTTGIECNVTYYISHVVGPPDSLGNVDFSNGCTRVGPGQPVLWRCEPTADAGDDPDPICGITDVTLSGTSMHGTGSWSGGLGEIADPDNPNTTYTPDSSEIGTVVTLTYTTEGDEGVCPSVFDEISFLVDEERIADAGADQIFCEIEDVQLSANSNGEPGMWSGGSGTFNDATLNNAVYSPDVSEQGEIITLTWTTTAGEGCPEVSDAMTIEIVDDLTAVPGEDRIACFLSTDLDAELPGNLNGVWTSADPGVVFEDVNSPSSEVTVPDLGTYCFTWTVSIGDCEHSDEVCITFVDAPVVVDTTFECNDVSTQYFVTILIEGGDASSYTVNGDPITGNEYISDWIGSNQPATFIINDVNDCGPYELNVRHVCECLTEVGSMNGPIQILCEDETANFSGFYNDSDEFLDGNDIRVYVLHDGDANDLGSILEMNTTGTFGFGAGMNFEESYWVAVGVGDSLGNALDLEDPCRLFSNSVEVIWYEYPDASIATPNILTCAVTEVTITANIDEPYIDYVWSTTNGNIVGASNMRDVVVSSVGTYTLVVTDTRSGCSSTDQITVTDDVTPPDVVIETPETLTCAVLEVEIDGSGSSSGNFTYEWSGPGIVANGTSPVVTVNAPGTYTLEVTNTDNGCTSDASMTVNQDIVPPVAAATVNAELDCSTDEVTISAQGSSEGAEFTYSWEVDGVDGNIVSGANQFDAVVDESGIYQLVVTNTDNGCRDTTTIEVIEIDDIITGATITTAGIDCFGDRDGVLTIEEVEGGTAPYRYSFDGGATFGNNPERVNVNPGTYDIVIEDARGCIYETPVTLVEPELLVVDLGPNVVVELGQTVTLTAEVNTDESNIEQWIWDPLLDPTCENCPDQVFLPEGETFVQLTVIDSNGCVATASVSVFITVVREIYIPNIFSPNRDGINDYFGIYTAPLRVREIKEFRIWDRWGEQMFQREGLPSPTELNETNAWDGTFNGEPMQPGVFIYYIVVEFADGVEEVYQGDFTLMR
nr:gliding motility-associated C-terminal domain-containing protein [Saprospiraceae bacterium]